MSETFMIDLHQAEMDDACPAKTWYNRFDCGKGLLNRDTILPERCLAETHADLRYLTKMMDISPEGIQLMVDRALDGLTPADRTDIRKMELLYRRLGWFASFALYMEPALRVTYENIVVDDEIVLDHDPLWIVTYPDRLVRDKATKAVTYLEYVPMPPGLTNKKWLDQWAYNPRLHIGMAAIEDLLKLKVADGQVMGLSEGYYSGVDGKMIHPYVWGYRTRDRMRWSNTYKSSEADGWEQAPIWEYPGGVVGWVQMCGMSVARYQFHYSKGVELDNKLVDKWVSQRLHRERTIRTMSDASHNNLHVRNIHFTRRTSQCAPAQGPACPYLKACWQPRLQGNPFAEGDYIPNVVPLVKIKEGEVVA
jgi:hypothetical protein